MCIRDRISTLETRIASLVSAEERQAKIPPTLSVVTSGMPPERPKTSRGLADPSPEEHSNYVVQSPGGSGDTAEGTLLLGAEKDVFIESPTRVECGEGTVPEISCDEGAGIRCCWDVQAIFRMEAEFFGSAPTQRGVPVVGL
eukprot:TRINITY_DN28533_c0_g1_i1.p1 TRINITY_DN28533_c0_g1~~TRINITY_DN28533_c0_g1_i1.p1  ORF type:complete len:142 (-),score=8.40 TRINITY_DN28533_c0_g1_i1:131-556(-)